MGCGCMKHVDLDKKLTKSMQSSWQYLIARHIFYQMKEVKCQVKNNVKGLGHVFLHAGSKC